MTLVVADTSVWARRSQVEVADALAETVEDNRLAMLVPLTLELLRSARGADDFTRLARAYGSLHQIPLTLDVQRRALVVQALLVRAGHHRAPSPVDLLVAAAAEGAGAEVWHCDRDFELIARVTGQPVRRLGR